MTQLNSVLEAKGLGLLYELVPKATAIAMLVNPNFPTTANQLSNLQAAARTAAWQLPALSSTARSSPGEALGAHYVGSIETASSASVAAPSGR